MSLYRAYYESFGCQMNAFDTEVIRSMMDEDGFDEVPSPDEADVIIVNTCSVRENAEQRALGRLNDLSRHSGALLVVCGCMSQRMGRRLFDLVQGLSIVCGPDNYRELPQKILEALGSDSRLTMLEKNKGVTYSLLSAGSRAKVSRFVSISRGCENFCSYCIVPYLRGPLRSKDPAAIIEEIRMLELAGVREITLLGQNVMAYSYGSTPFVSLLEKILAGTQIARVRFLTTHPRDADMDLFRLMAAESRICPHIHLPFQSGSDRILKLMRRGYESGKYISIVEEARRIKSDLAVTTDIIVGFPSETEKDFEDTLRVVETGKFDSAFTFKYSPREGTGAYEMSDDVPLELKKERLRILNEKISRIRGEILEGRLGAEDEILLDGYVKKGEYQFWKGRTPHFRNVLLEGSDLSEGDVIPIVLKEMRNFTYIGERACRR